MNYTIGDTPLQKDIVQSQHGDFLWVLPFVDVAADKTETETDLTGASFAMVFKDLSGAEMLTLAIGDGITVSDNIVTVSIDLTDYDPFKPGCKYPYYFTYTTAGGHTKCLFSGKFMIQ